LSVWCYVQYIPLHEVNGHGTYIMQLSKLKTGKNPSNQELQIVLERILECIQDLKHFPDFNIWLIDVCLLILPVYETCKKWELELWLSLLHRNPIPCSLDCLNHFVPQFLGLDSFRKSSSVFFICFLHHTSCWITLAKAKFDQLHNTLECNWSNFALGSMICQSLYKCFLLRWFIFIVQCLNLTFLLPMQSNFKCTSSDKNSSSSHCHEVKS